MFDRPHHQLIAQILLSLDGPLLREYNCLFGGGTAIALRYGEYRESVDVDFLVSDINSYRQLRMLTTSASSIATLFRPNSEHISQCRDIRADQYGIRTMLGVSGKRVKFEIVLEGRMELQRPGTEDSICGIATLSALDMLTSKLLANSDRWHDDGVFNRDIIDLAMIHPTRKLFSAALKKAEGAYGEAVSRDIIKAVEKFELRHEWLQRCMLAMDINLPPAVLWERIRTIMRYLPR